MANGFTNAQLQTEINTDPKTLGYAALRAANNYIGLAAKLNATYAGVVAVFRNDVKSAEILAAMIESEVSSLTQIQWTRVQVLLAPPVIDASQVTIRNQFGGIFAGKTTTLGNLTAVGQKAATTRAEELWGYKVVVTEQDVATAINP